MLETGMLGLFRRSKYFFRGLDFSVEKWSTIWNGVSRRFPSKTLFFPYVPMQNFTPEPHFVSQIDVVPSCVSVVPKQEPFGELCSLMREMISAQDRQNELLEELIGQVGQTQRRKVLELALWKRSNPELAEYCKRAASKLERVQTDLLASIAEEVDSNADVLLDSEFGLSEFIDRFGPKFMHLNGLFQILTQLGNAPEIQFHRQEANHRQETETNA